MTLDQIFTLGLVLVLLIAVSSIFSIMSMHSRMKFEREMLERGYIQFRTTDDGPLVWIPQEFLETYTACTISLMEEIKDESNGN